MQRSVLHWLHPLLLLLRCSLIVACLVGVFASLVNVRRWTSQMLVVVMEQDNGVWRATSVSSTPKKAGTRPLDFKNSPVGNRIAIPNQGPLVDIVFVTQRTRGWPMVVSNSWNIEANFAFVPYPAALVEAATLAVQEKIAKRELDWPVELGTRNPMTHWRVRGIIGDACAYALALAGLYVLGTGFEAAAKRLCPRRLLKQCPECGYVLDEPRPSFCPKCSTKF